LDSDDIWLEGHLKNGLEFFNKHPEIDVLFGNFTTADYETGKHNYNFFDQKKLLHTLKAVEVFPGIELLQHNLFEALIQENFFHLGSSIVRKSSLKGILMDESIMYAEDRDFAIKLYKKAEATFSYRTDPVFVLYTHDASLCSRNADTTQKILNAHIHLLKKYLKTYDLSINEKRISMRLLATKLSNTAYLYGKNKDYDNAFSCLLESFKYKRTIAQIKDFMKVLMTIIYVPKTTY
jgi:hypothetical protein